MEKEAQNTPIWVTEIEQRFDNFLERRGKVWWTLYKTETNSEPIQSREIDNPDDSFNALINAVSYNRKFIKIGKIRLYSRKNDSHPEIITFDGDKAKNTVMRNYNYQQPVTPQVPNNNNRIEDLILKISDLQYQMQLNQLKQNNEREKEDLYAKIHQLETAPKPNGVEKLMDYVENFMNSKAGNMLLAQQMQKKINQNTQASNPQNQAQTPNPINNQNMMQHNQAQNNQSREINPNQPLDQENAVYAQTGIGICQAIKANLGIEEPHNLLIKAFDYIIKGVKSGDPDVMQLLMKMQQEIQ